MLSDDISLLFITLTTVSLLIRVIVCVCVCVCVIEAALLSHATGGEKSIFVPWYHCSFVVLS